MSTLNLYNDPLPHFPPGVDPTRRNIAYGKFGIPSLSDHLLTRQKGLITLGEVLHKSESIAAALSQTHAIGRKEIEESGSLIHLAAMVNDPDVLVRMKVHETLARQCASSHNSIKMLIQKKVVGKLVSSLESETPEIKTIILKTLYYIIRLDPHEALINNAIQTFLNLLSDVKSNPDILVSTCNALCILCATSEGKTLAVMSDVIPTLIHLLEDIRIQVREAAAASLMIMTIDIDAKGKVIRDGNHLLLDLLSDPSDKVKLNVVQTIANCAEDYSGRVYYQQYALLQLKKLANPPEEATTDKEQLAAAAKRAIAVIEWKP